MVRLAMAYVPSRAVAEEVAQAVEMVLGNDYMTGQTILINGGMAFV